ncbi:MAG: hypothetical protein JKY88_10875 [Pseudomonadales bacterium]|nr:hypothetical protein [Pseudomonadales bacterium]
MNILEISRYTHQPSKPSNPNYWLKIKQLMDRTFKLGNDSQLKRISQGFDQATGEHVIRLEYRVKASNQNPIAKKPARIKSKPSDDDKKK